MTGLATAESVEPDLKFGDLVRVYWLDASEAMGRTGEGGEPHFDTPVASIGHYLGV